MDDVWDDLDEDLSCDPGVMAAEQAYWDWAAAGGAGCPPGWSTFTPEPEQTAALDGFLWERITAMPSASLAQRAARMTALARFASATVGLLYAEAAGYHDDYEAMLLDAPPDPHARATDAFSCTAAVLSMATRVAPSTAKAQLKEALDLRRQAPATATALREGRVNRTTARAVLEETAPLDEKTARKVDASLFPKADTQFPAQVRRAARKATITADPKAAAARGEQVRRGRHVEFRSRADGMASVNTFLPVEDALAVYEAIKAHGRAKSGPEDVREYPQRCADAFVDLILNPGGKRADVKVRMHVVATVGSLLDLTTAPAELAGYGPITADLARQLAADATWSRILLDPTGEVLEMGSTRYRPSAATARRVKGRDRHCRAPGCHRPARQSHLDHTIPHPAGATDHTNLACLCEFHHRVKHLLGWELVQEPGGRLVWKTPDGHTYTTDPPDLPGWIADKDQD